MRYLVPLLFGLGGAAILIGLGVWQLQRLDWKREIIATAEAQMGAPAGPLPATANPDGDAYRHVAVAGTILPQELHVLTSQPPLGIGFKVIAAMETADGRRLMVDRGFVPEADKIAPRPPVEGTVTGILLWPKETDLFTPEPDTEGNMWFARDVDTMAKALGTEPLMIVETEPLGEAAPLPLPVTANFRNEHLQYALTWFALAVVWLGMTVYWVVRIRREAD